ncbi:endo-1,4-beta-xylanase [Streptomyces drozdowiczii]|uniref:Beta-xylanase n=1 Tax=Streptomyces drozdowiczii TaxID=202862 RepID=A0ABY6Q0G8_9ACTN|nr:endo-1,4-beta-xylanase [Streptomyces drozdowiczii]MCX0242474.1 endo-1,4-beta-xylanase [Streptomyces drozdowiczii]UZK57469.1 endo-1,4-beta-xylanase [Streptomyces drozdowiczii]
MRKPIKAVLIGTAAAALLAPCTINAFAHSEHGGPKDPRDTTLGALGQRSGVRIGTAVDMAALADDAPYRAKAASEFSSVTPENVMKWEVVEPSRGRYDWKEADKLVDFARANGQLVRGHTLLWHNQLPSWLTTGDFTADELRAILRKHITDEARHFKGRIWQWDVVNEAFNDDGTLRDSIWLRKLGPGYIADAFRWAHAADPKAKLFINDYNIEGVNAKSTALHDLVVKLRKQHVPIDGVGIQGHLSVQYNAPHDIAENMKRFDALGLETAITEADVRVPMPSDSTEQEAQAEGYDVLLRGCLLTRKCTDFTVWGFTDKYSWVPGTFEGEGAANLYDENYRAKPAYSALRDDLLLAAGRG